MSFGASPHGAWNFGAGIQSAQLGNLVIVPSGPAFFSGGDIRYFQSTGLDYTTVAPHIAVSGSGTVRTGELTGVTLLSGTTQASSSIVRSSTLSAALDVEFSLNSLTVPLGTSVTVSLTSSSDVCSLSFSRLSSSRAMNGIVSSASLGSQEVWRHTQDQNSLLPTPTTVRLRQRNSYFWVLFDGNVVLRKTRLGDVTPTFWKVVVSNLDAPVSAGVSMSWHSRPVCTFAGEEVWNVSGQSPLYTVSMPKITSGALSAPFVVYGADGQAANSANIDVRPGPKDRIREIGTSLFAALSP